MIKYRANTMFRSSGGIKPIEIDKETDASVFFDGRREAKSAEMQSWFDTLKEAKTFQINRAKRRIAELQGDLTRAENWLTRLNTLKDERDD